MTARYTLVTTRRFERQALQLPSAVFTQLRRRLCTIVGDPRHPSLKTHEVKHAVGDFGGKVFEGCVNEKYRFTWEYGSSSEIVLRNVDNHDACLKRP
ncbi:MAG: hypothetical protein HYU64_15140 [Armatimonadetes bacterium]|nr:hypothetical protein [Armatimonadota bacterium]